MSCILCKNSELLFITDQLRQIGEYKIVKCTQCGHYQLFPLPTKKENIQFYEDNQQDKLSGVSMVENRLHVDTQRRVDYMRYNFPKEISILDVGTGYGHFVTAMRKIGFENIDGQEPSSGRAPVWAIQEDIENLDYQYDIITLFHVLEHVFDPKSLLKKIRNLLNPGGVVLIEVPNIDEALMNSSPAYTKFNFFRAHLSYFNASILENLIVSTGFKEVSVHPIQRYSVLNVLNWLKTGEPQLENPSFIVPNKYKFIDNAFRDKMVENGTTDTLWARGVV